METAGNTRQDKYGLYLRYLRLYLSELQLLIPNMKYLDPERERYIVHLATMMERTANELKAEIERV